MKKIKVKYWIVGIVAFLAILTASFFAGKYVSKKAAQVEINNYSALLDSVSKYKIKIKGLEMDVYEKGQLILTQKQAIEVGIIDKKLLKELNIKQLNQITTLSARIDILIDSVKHGGQIVYIPVTLGSTENKPAILLPFPFKDSTQYYNFYGQFDIKGKMSANLSIPPFDIKLVSGTDNNGRAKISVIPSNTYVKINDLRSADIPQAKPRDKRFGVGVSLGAMMNLTPPIKIAPAVGLTLNYNFIRF